MSFSFIDWNQSSFLPHVGKDTIFNAHIANAEYCGCNGMNAFMHLNVIFVVRPTKRLYNHFTFKYQIPTGLRAGVVYSFIFMLSYVRQA
jgi:hypothetical protein